MTAIWKRVSIAPINQIKKIRQCWQPSLALPFATGYKVSFTCDTNTSIITTPRPARCDPLNLRLPPAAFRGTPSHHVVSPGKKRSLSQIDAVDRPSKRKRSESPVKSKDVTIQNRVHQRVLMRECGKAICLAESPAILLESIAQCVGDHKALYEAGILHRDISINNLIINVDRSNPALLGFLIDLDLATKIPRETASGAASRTGTRAFMSIGVLLGDPHSFMDDLESFFWVLYWICVHFESSDTCRIVDKFEKWNYEKNPQEIARNKYGVIAEDSLTGLWKIIALITTSHSFHVCASFEI
ncbi:hypothetical protein J3F84DRAFT_265061 [Trichoderma pleuroticola]